MKRTFARIALVLIGFGALPLLMGPSGGYPSRPRFQSVGIGAVPSGTDFTLSQASAAAFPIFQTWCSNGSTSGARCWAWFENASIAGLSLKATQDNGTLNPGTVFSATRGGANLSDIQIGDTTSNATFEVRGTGVISLGDAGVTSINGGGVDLTPTTGTFTSNPQGTGCTTSTITWSYARVGKLVSLKITGKTGFPVACSGATMLDGTANMPAAIRPATDQTQLMAPSFTNNATLTLGCIFVRSGGGIDMGVAPTGGSNCANGSWSGVGNRDFPLGASFTFSKD